MTMDMNELSFEPSLLVQEALYWDEVEEEDDGIPRSYNTQKEPPCPECGRVGFHKMDCSRGVYANPPREERGSTSFGSIAPSGKRDFGV